MGYPYKSTDLAGATHKMGVIKTPEFSPEDLNNLYFDWKARRL